MNWARRDWLYQWTHWWHWLTYGQNASALGLVGLVLYVLYIRKMMMTAEVTRRLTLTPYLVARASGSLSPEFTVVNVSAPAVRCEVWHQPVSESFRLTGVFLQRSPELEAWYQPVITQQEPYTFPAITEGPPKLLYVIECHDTANGKYQLQVLQTSIGDQQASIQSVFVIPEVHLLWWRRVLNAGQQWRALRLMRKSGD